MKQLFTLIALGSVALVSAEQSYQPYGNGLEACPPYNDGRGYYQEQSNNANYYQQRGESNQRQSPQGYYQRDERNYQRNNQYDYQQQQPQQQPRNQPYDQNQQYYQQPSRNQPYDQNQQYQQYYQQPSRNQPYDQNQQYYQQQGNQSYDRDQQRNYDNTRVSHKDRDQRVASTDQEINKRIQEKLSSSWFSKGFQNVAFDVNSGNVTLRGSVDTLEHKNKIEESVRKIDGVKQVNNQITIVKESPNTYSDSQLQNSEKKYPQDFASNAQDRQLNAKIRDKLSNGWFSKGYETLVFNTTDGVVTISGTVDKLEDVQKVGDQIKDIDGVKSVNNQLTVKNG